MNILCGVGIVVVVVSLFLGQRREFRRGYSLALDHTLDEVRRLRAPIGVTLVGSPEHKEHRDLRLTVIDILLKLQKENDDG